MEVMRSARSSVALGVVLALGPALIGPAVVANAQQVHWLRQFGGVHMDAAYDVATDGSGGVIAVGNLYTGPPLDSDAYVIRYDAAGSVVSSLRFGTASHDQANGVATDMSGSMVVVGIAGVGSVPGSPDAFVSKYVSGIRTWTRQFPASGTDPYITATAVALDSGGNVFVGGEIQGVLPGEIDSGSRDAFLRKYDSNGTILWTRQFGSPRFERLSAVAADQVGGVYVAGTIYPPGAPITAEAAFLRRYGPDGTLAWAVEFSTASGASANGLAAGASGVLVTGSTTGTFPGQTSAGGEDAYVRRFDPAGALIWTRQFGTAGRDSGTGLAFDGGSRLYVAGFVEGAAFPGNVSLGAEDAFVSAFGFDDGTTLWTHQFGTSLSESAHGVAVDGPNVFVAGVTEVDPGYGKSVGFVAKISTLPPGTTTPGDDVTVAPIDPVTGTSPVTLTFDSVTEGGTTTVTTSSTGTPPPSGFRLGTPPTYYEVSTTATTSGSIEVCISYAGVQYGNENNIRLFHYEDSNGDGSPDAWVDRTSSVDTTAEVVCATVPSLSPFILAETAFAFTGFLRPIVASPSVNVVKAGAAVPIKFSLGGDKGLGITAAGYPTSVAISCVSGAAAENVEETVAAGGSSLTYDPTSDQYVYVWKTDKSWSGQCRQLTVRLTDGSQQRADFRFDR